MHDADDRPYPAAWDDDLAAIHPQDPRLGAEGVLATFGPSAGLRARVAELTQYYVGRSPHTERVLLDLVRDVAHGRSEGWLPLVVALLEQFAQTATAAQGESLTLRRLAGDVEDARSEALMLDREGLS